MMYGSLWEIFGPSFSKWWVVGLGRYFFHMLQKHKLVYDCFPCLNLGMSRHLPGSGRHAPAHALVRLTRCQLVSWQGYSLTFCF